MRTRGGQCAEGRGTGPDLNASSSGRAPKRKRDNPGLLQEKAAVFDRVLDLKRASVHRQRHFAFGFTTDGVSLHLNTHGAAAQGGAAQGGQGQQGRAAAADARPPLERRAQGGRALGRALA